MVRNRILVLMIVIGVAACDDEPQLKAVTTDSEARVVFRSESGEVLTTEDLKRSEGAVNYGIVGSDVIPEEANRRHQEARQLGASGNYEEALEQLAKAHSLAPSWAYPLYDSAFTYLLIRDYVKAREFYAKTVALSPNGFFTAITALDTLNREADGDLPEGTYAAYMSLEWIDDPSLKDKLVAALVEKLPSFAPAWKEYALTLDDPVEKLGALEIGLTANPDSETKGILLINKALAISESGDKETAIEILGTIALDSTSTFGNKHLAKQALAMITD